MYSWVEFDSWFGGVIVVGTLVLIALLTAAFIREKQKRLHLFPHPHVSRPSRG